MSDRKTDFTVAAEAGRQVGLGCDVSPAGLARLWREFFQLSVEEQRFFGTTWLAAAFRGMGHRPGPGQLKTLHLRALHAEARNAETLPFAMVAAGAVAIDRLNFQCEFLARKGALIREAGESSDEVSVPAAFSARQPLPALDEGHAREYGTEAGAALAKLFLDTPVPTTSDPTFATDNFGMRVSWIISGLASFLSSLRSFDSGSIERAGVEPTIAAAALDAALRVLEGPPPQEERYGSNTRPQVPRGWLLRALLSPRHTPFMPDGARQAVFAAFLETAELSPRLRADIISARDDGCWVCTTGDGTASLGVAITRHPAGFLTDKPPVVQIAPASRARNALPRLPIPGREDPPEFVVIDDTTVDFAATLGELGGDAVLHGYRPGVVQRASRQAGAGPFRIQQADGAARSPETVRSIRRAELSLRRVG